MSAQAQPWEEAGCIEGDTLPPTLGRPLVRWDTRAQGQAAGREGFLKRVAFLQAEEVLGCEAW